MTLALHGKSRQRQFLLILLALVTVGAAVFGGTVVQRATPASAAYNYVSLTVGGESLPGNTVTVQPGATIPVSFTINLTGGDDWECTDWRISTGGGGNTDVNHADNSGNGNHTVNFNMTAPGSNGTYDLRLRAYDNDSCNGGADATFEYDNVIVVQTTPPAQLIPAPNLNPGGFNQCVAPNIMLVIDNSTSIGASELANMKTAVNSMIGQVESALPGTNWAGVHFRRSLNNNTISTPTSGWNSGTGAITTFVNGAVSDGYTPTANGINAAIGLGTGTAGQPPLMIIITDGDPNVELNDGDSADTDEAAYVNGAIDAVTQANNARTGGWNTLLAFFGPGDSFAQQALGGDYAAYNAAVRNGLAGIPNGTPTGTQISVANASGLADAITNALLANCQGSVTINKLLDGETANDWQFTASVSGGTADPAGPYTTAGAGSTNFNIDFPAPSSTATVSITETGIGGSFDSGTYSFENAVCTGSLNDGAHSVDTGTRTISGIQVGNNSIVTCTFDNTTNPTTNGLTVKKMVWNGTAYVEDPGLIWNLRYRVAGTQDAYTPVLHGVTTQVPFETYQVTEDLPTGWQRTGVSNVANPEGLTCPSEPLIPNDPPVVGVSNTGTAGIVVDETTSRLVCFYNQRLREITVQKMVPNPAGGWMEDNQPTFWGFKVGPTNVYGDSQDVDNGATNSFVAGSDLYVFEQVPAGWQRVGYTREAGADATCDTTGFANTTTGGAGSTVGINIGDTFPETVCFYNERDLEPVTVTKTGNGTYDVDWSVTKTVTPDVLNLPENGQGDTVYTVDVDKTITNVRATGLVTITNPNPVAIQVNLSDPGVNLNGDCISNPVTVPANGGQVQCTWNQEIGGSTIPTDYTNTVTVSGPWDGPDVEGFTGPVVFTILNGTNEVTVNDNFAGNVTGPVAKPNGDVISTSSTFEYTATHTCEGIDNWSQVDGSGSKTVENTATISDEVNNNNSDDADVDVNCQLRKVTLVKVVEGGNAQPGEWLLTATDNDGGVDWTFFGTSPKVGFVPTQWSFNLSESDGPAGYTLDRILCAAGNGPDNDFTNGPVNLSGANNDDVLCTFYNVADQGLVIEKTASGLYDDVWNWTIEKDGETTATTSEAGALFGVGYNTTSTPTITGRENGTVDGEVTITNDNNFDIDVTIEDSLGDFDTLTCEATPGGPIANPGNGFTVPANGSVECDYTVVNADTDATTNTVTVTSSEYPDLDGSDDATISWLSRLNPADPAFLEDTDNRGSSPVARAYTNETSVQVEDYARNFRCPAWPSELYYDDQGNFTGEHTFDIVNTAVLYKNDNLEGDEWDRDDHTVAVTCTVEEGSVDVQKTVDWNGVGPDDQPEASFDICIAGPFEDMTAAIDFLTSMPSTPFAPNSAPSGDWLECDTVAPGEFAEFDELEPGAYAVAEKDPGAAYFQSLGPWAVNVEPGDEHRLAGEDGIINEYQLGDLTVTKNIELAGGELPAGSEFDICIQGPSYPVGTEDAACRTFTTDEQAETWTGLIPGAYTVSEINTEPDGVQWATTITNNGDVTVPAGGEASATVTNTLVTGDLAVTKVIEWSGYAPEEGDLDGSPWAGFEICIEGPSYPLGDEAGACQLVTNVNGQTLQWDNLAAGTYTVTETDPGTQWSVVVDPDDAGSTGVVTCAPTDDQCETPQVTITNTLAPASLTICKDFVGDETDEGVLPGIQVDGQSIETPWDEGDCFTIDVAPFTPVTVAEVLPEGYFPADEPTLSGVCSIQQQEEIVAELIIAQTLSFLGLELVEAWLEADLSGIPAGESCTVTFTNQPVGELIIVKDDNVNTEEPVTWLFDVTDGEDTDVVGINGSGSFGPEFVATGDYSVTEQDVDGLNRVDVCEVDSPAGSYQVRVQVGASEPVLGARADITITRGETTTVTFYNDDCGRVLGGANLLVNKFEASAEGAFSGSTGLEGWTMNLSCIAGECESGGFPGTLDTDAAGLASFGAVPTGRYEVCEVPQTGYDVVGSLLDGGDSQAGTCREIIVTEEAAGPDGNIVVDFYNYPLGGLRVEKRQLEAGSLDVSDNGGWEITVEGCGESFTQTTNEAIPNSWTVFENLPACDDYVVSENVNSKPGYTPVGPASFEFSFNPGDDLVFTFVNDTVPENTPTNTPETGETPTPTNTPENTPTNTPEPTNTPVDPTEEPTSTPTPIDEVEGEITPGPTEDPGSAATPIPPASGTGNSILGTGTGSSMFMVLLALLMTSTGLAALAMARGRANGASRR